MGEDLAADRPPTPAPRRRWGWVVAARLGALAAVAGLIAWYVAGHWSDFRVVTHLGAAALVGAVVLDVVVYVYGAGAILVVVRVFGVRLGAVEAWMSAVVTRFGNILTPFRGGAVARALYLNKTHGLAYAHFLAGMSGMLVSSVAVNVLCALAGLAYLHLAAGPLLWEAMAVLAAALAAMVVLTAVRPRMQQRGSPLRRQLARLVNGWDAICRRPGAIAALLVLYALHALTMAAIYALLLADMGRAMPWGLLIFVVALGNISLIVQITPGNVGVYEGALAVIGSLVGLEPTDILAAALTWRVLDALLILVAGPVCGHFLTRRAR